MFKKNLYLYLLIIVVSTYGQHEKRGVLNIKKIGFLYNSGANENFIFNDTDYNYSTDSYKLQVFYDIGTWKKVDFQLSIQPQIQKLKHQLNNKYFVTPDQTNYIDKRDEFVLPKTMHLYGLEFGFVSSIQLYNKIAFQSTIGLGFCYINTRTERLAEGFTFIENFSLGLSYNIFKKSYVYIGTNFGHVSNLNFQKPNSGYNILGLEVSYAIKL